MTNHKWNILNIMRFYNRIGKQFNAKVYLDFITPHEGSNVKNKKAPPLSEIYTYIRRYIANGWCERAGDNVVMTQKGLMALMEWEKKTALARAEKREQDYLAKGFARPNTRGPDGSYLPGTRKSRK